jgi:hypothetical protein
VDKKLWEIMHSPHTAPHTQIYNKILLSHENKEILPFATTWNLEIIMLSETIHTHKGKH